MQSAKRSKQRCTLGATRCVDGYVEVCQISDDMEPDWLPTSELCETATTLGEMVDLSSDMPSKAASVEIASGLLGNIQLSGSKVSISVSAALELSGVTIPAQGEGYLTVGARIYEQGGNYRNSVGISAVDITPAGPDGLFTCNKVLTNIPRGKYLFSVGFTSYCKTNNRFKYSTFMTIEADGKTIWAHQLVATPGQESPKYEDFYIDFEVL